MLSEKKLVCQRGCRAKKLRGWSDSAADSQCRAIYFIKFLKFCVTPFFGPYLGVSNTPYLGSDVTVLHLLLVVGGRVIQCVTGSGQWLRLWSYYWGPNRSASLRFLVWKGRCHVLLYKLGWKQQLYVQGIRLYAQIFVRSNVFFAIWFTLCQPSTPVTNAVHARIYGPFVLETIFMRLERETLCPVTLPH